jgi:hypothetical protein
VNSIRKKNGSWHFRSELTLKTANMIGSSIKDNSMSKKSTNRKSKNVRPDYLKPGKYLTTDHAEKLRQYVKNEAVRDSKRDSKRPLLNQMIIEILLASRPVLRAEELCRLQIRDLPTYHGTNFILVRKNGIIVQAKEVTDEFCTKLKTYIKRCRKSAKPKSYLLTGEQDYRVQCSIVTRGGRPAKIKERTNRLSYHSLYSKVKFIGRQVNIPNLCPNMFLYLVSSEAERRRQADSFML